MNIFRSCSRYLAAHKRIFDVAEEYFGKQYGIKFDNMIEEYKKEIEDEKRGNERKVIWSDDSNYPDIICVFILSQDTINKYPWEEIRRTNNYLVRYDYTREQLEGLDYTIEYPPTPRMKDIHMYPEFSTFYKYNE